MHPKKRSYALLLLIIPAVLLLGFIIWSFPPQTRIDIPVLSIPILVLFFILLFIFIISLVTFLFKSKIHGVLAASFVVTYLLLRLNNLRSIFFLLILAALFVVLELLFAGQKDRRSGLDNKIE